MPIQFNAGDKVRVMNNPETEKAKTNNKLGVLQEGSVPSWFEGKLCWYVVSGPDLLRIPEEDLIKL